MQEYEDLIHIRNQEVDGLGPWHWLKSDSGAWEGPKTDWENHHKHKWLNHVKNFEICFQGGSCQGMYPRLLSRLFKNVYTCEADHLNFYVAGLNCQVPNVFRYNAAIGETSGFISVQRSHMNNVGMHTVGGPGPVPVFTIDSFNFPFCGLIALDIEGYEIHAIRGAIETIKRCSPVIVLERPSAECQKIILDLGYHIDCQSMADTVFVKS